MHAIDRRQFHSAALAAVAGPVIATSLIRGDEAPSKKITLGFIGVGTMGLGHVHAFLGLKDVQILAVADVVAERRDNAKKVVDDHYSKQTKATNNDCKAYNDFQELLGRKDIDAVVISTPDHWHAIPCVLAAKAKKDIYCEKPLTHAIAHGRKVVQAVEANKVIFQTGSQQRSEYDRQFRKAAAYVRSGRLGRIQTVCVGVGAAAVECKLPAQEAPKGTDWNFWLGPAPERAYHSDLCPRGVHKHFPAWRNYKEYAGGGLSDMGAHHFDIAQWALNMDGSGPVKIEPPEKGNSGLKFTYANGVVMVHGGPSGCTFVGEKGIIWVDRGQLHSIPAKLLQTPLKDKDVTLHDATDHKRNWLECIKSRKPTICPAEVGHRTSTVCQLGNIGNWLRRTLKWEPAKEQFLDDKEANALVARELRSPWKL
jgi:predicted dehydrogenase